MEIYPPRMNSIPQILSLVVIPTYNEAGNIAALVPAVLEKSPLVHVLVVDDNSPDGTGAIADGLAHAHAGRVHVLHRAQKEGLGRAYLAGFAWGLARDYGAFVEMDADFSHDPLYLPSLLDTPSDVVIGSRYLNGISVINWPLRRILLSWGANQYVQTVTRLPVHDCTSGFRLYRRNALLGMGLETVTSNGYSFQVEMTFRAHAAGFSITEVPIIFTERRAGQSKMSRRVVWESLWMPLTLRLRGAKLRRELRENALTPAGVPDRK